MQHFDVCMQCACGDGILEWIPSLSRACWLVAGGPEAQPLQQAATNGGAVTDRDATTLPASAPARADSLAAVLARQDSLAALLRQDSAGKWDSGTATLGHQDSLAALLSQSSLGKLFRQVGARLSRRLGA